MKVLGQLREAIAPVVDLVYPPRCPLCGDGIEAQSGLCGACWSELAIPSSLACAGCQRPLVAKPDQPQLQCGACLSAPPRHDGVAAATFYNDASRKLVLAFKHGGRIAMASMLARLMAARLPALDESALLVPVPLHRLRLWRRGFNQSALLARELERLGRGKLMVDALVRTKATPALGGHGRKERAAILSNAIVANPRRSADLRGRDVILVDDVLTSGATSDACVAALKSGGANRVTISCFARVVDW